MFSNFYIQQRIKKASSLREIGKNPYSTNAKRTLSNAEFLQKYAFLKAQQDTNDTSTPNDSKPCECVVGRVRFIRLMGKACFIKIQDQSGILQAYISTNELGEQFDEVKKILEVGDFVNVCGFGFVTKMGELSIHALEFSILSKAIVPLPEKFHGLSDIELRYRQRYVDLIVNDDVKQTFVLRSKIIACVRDFSVIKRVF